MDKVERIFVCVKSQGDETLVGVDVCQKNDEGNFETLASLRAEIDDRSHRATIKKNKSTTKEQNFEGYYKCNRQFGIVAKDLNVKEIYDEREQTLSKVETANKSTRAV